MKKLLIVLICLSQALIAQTPSKNELVDFVNYFDKEAANPAKVFSIETKYYPTNREFIVYTPASYKKTGHSRYPVLYLLDGKSKIKQLIFTANTLASKRKMPEIIIVALPAGETRQQDYTPNYLFKHSSNEKGDAKNFSQFIKFDLIPFIDSHFRTEPYRIISGHSRSGLFIINDLINKTGLFNAHFAFSPALWPNDFAIINQLQANKSHEGFLYVNVGDEENQKMKSSLLKLVHLLEKSNTNKLNWGFDIAANESHSTTAIIGHHMALRKLYTNWDKPWEAYFEQGLKVIPQQYTLLSNEFNYRVVPDERALNSIGYQFLKKNKTLKAIEAFKMNSLYHPKSANSYDSLADALEIQGELDEAILIIDKALLLLDGEGDPNHATIIKHRNQLYKKTLKDRHLKSHKFK